jgi:hypothetical protein
MRICEIRSLPSREIVWMSVEPNALEFQRPYVLSLVHGLSLDGNHLRITLYNVMANIAILVRSVRSASRERAHRLWSAGFRSICFGYSPAKSSQGIQKGWELVHLSNACKHSGYRSGLRTAHTALSRNLCSKETKRPDRSDSQDRTEDPQNPFIFVPDSVCS